MISFIERGSEIQFILRVYFIKCMCARADYQTTEESNLHKVFLSETPAGMNRIVFEK